MKNWVEEMRRTALELERGGFPQDVIDGNRELAEYIERLQNAAVKVCNTRYSSAEWEELNAAIGDLCDVVPQEKVNRRAGGTAT